MRKEGLNPIDTTIRFLDYVARLKKGIPKACKRGSIPEFVLDDRVKLEDQIRRAWDEYGRGYLLEESKEAYATTMLMLMNNMQVPRPGEKWLSLGSGPGVYEIFLAHAFSPVEITSLDVSPEQIKIQTELIRDMVRRNPHVGGRVKPVRGSMANLAELGAGFRQIMCINSLQWCDEWKRVVAGINRALSLEEGSRVYATIGSVRLADGQTAWALDLDTDTLLDEFESHNLRVKVFRYLKVRGQFRVFTPRFYAVFERDSRLTGRWADRVMVGQTEFIDYDEVMGGMMMGAIAVVNHSASLRRQLPQRQ